MGVPIAYSVRSDFARQLSSQDTTELYLLDKNGVVEGFIGTVNPNQQTYSWKPANLAHWAGLDIITKAPNAGDYELLLVSRKKTLVKNPQGDYPADIFVDGITKYDGTKVVVTDNGQPTYPDVLALAVSGIVTLQANESNTQSNNQIDWKNTVLREFSGLTDWLQSNPSDWQLVDYTDETQHRTQLKKYGTGKILLLSKFFNGNGCQSDCSAEGKAQDNLVASVKAALAQNGWSPVQWPAEPYFYMDYLYVKDGHPLLLQVGTRDAITGGLYVDIEFQY